MDVLRQPIAEELAAWESFKAAGLGVDAIKAQLVRPPKRDMGDVALGCFVFAKNVGIKPNEMALKLAAGSSQLAVREQQTANREPRIIESATAAGPYVNFKLSRAACIGRVLSEIERTCPGNSIDDAPLWSFGASEEGKGKTLVLDFSSPNIAKPLAVHHLRSTMIGYAIKKIRESQGWCVVGINHLGDWGTGFGKLIAGLKREASNPESTIRLSLMPPYDLLPLGNLDVRELNAVYQKFSKAVALDASLEAAGREAFAHLEQYMVTQQPVFGRSQPVDNQVQPHPGKLNYYIWHQAREISLAAFQRVYDRLGLQFVDWSDPQNRNAATRSGAYRQYALYIGESFYVGKNDFCGAVIGLAKERGVGETSDGALVIFVDRSPDKDGRLKTPPLMLLKNDGATSYHARDLASAVYRHRTFGFSEAVYVVGGEQTLHFKQLFKALELLGFAWAKGCTHVDFGLLLFKQPDGKWAKASTRAGRVIMLEDLLDESVDAVREIIREKNAALAGDAAMAERVAQAVGVGAVIFNDLKNGRRNDIKFDWDEVLNFQGETGPYMLMQYVRMGSVTEKFFEAAQAKGWGAHSWEHGDVSQLKRDDEFELAMLLAAFPEALRRASAEYEPSIVARQLIDIAAQTSSWWTNTKDTRIVGEDAELSKARVRLVNAVRKVLGRGLLLLGMTLVERM
jgi:arginyl-tRNA synthetase